MRRLVPLAAAAAILLPAALAPAGSVAPLAGHYAGTTNYGHHVTFTLDFLTVRHFRLGRVFELAPTEIKQNSSGYWEFNIHHGHYRIKLTFTGQASAHGVVADVNQPRGTASQTFSARHQG